MDQLRAAAYLDLLNAVSADARIAAGLLPGAVSTGSASGDSDATGAGPDDPSGGGEPDDGRPDGGALGADGPDGGPGDSGPGRGGSDDPDPDRGTPGAAAPRLTDLVLPLATLLGLTRQPGEGHGLGPLDPSLCQSLAAAATASSDSRLCVTVTDADGIAVGHGCVKLSRAAPGPAPAPSATHPLAALPARVNLTIPAVRLASLANATGPPGQASWSLTRARDQAEPSGGFGCWMLNLPSGRILTVSLVPVPTFDCDHRNQSHAYQPNDTLRHLVQIRDYECTFPQCSRHARESDFEHARPYDRGGPTCACNAGARSRQCHRVKQSEGWHVSQPRPGWHQWQTPAGRIYVQGPKRYPA
jgi:hypothetical protein